MLSCSKRSKRRRTREDRNDWDMKIVLLTHSERRALARTIAPMYRFTDTTEGPTKGDLVVLGRDREPILRFRGRDE